MIKWFIFGFCVCAIINLAIYDIFLWRKHRKIKWYQADGKTLLCPYEPFTLVKAVEDSEYLPEGYLGDLGLVKDREDYFLFIGEINEMKGHGVYIRRRDDKLFSCLHTDEFEKVPYDEHTTEIIL